MAGRKASGGAAAGSATGAPASPSASSSISGVSSRAARSSTSATTATATPHSRTHRGLTCANCRARKTRCDGSQPTCKTCEVYRDTCRYEKPPPMSQIVAMARRLQDAEQTVASLRAELAAERDRSRQSQFQPQPQPQTQTQTQTQQPQPRPPQAASTVSVASAALSLSPAGAPLKREDVSPAATTATTDSRSAPPPPPRRASQDILFDLSVDSNGKLCYVGPTSAVHNPPVIAAAHTSPIQTYDERAEGDGDVDGKSAHQEHTSRPMMHQQQKQPLRHAHAHTDRRATTTTTTMTTMTTTTATATATAATTAATATPTTTAAAAPPPHLSTTTKADVRSLLTTKAIESRAWEAFALGSAAAQTDLPRAALARLLQIHWVWIAPMFMWVYRPAFMRDMARGEGKYYSPLLLMILCGHAARFEGGGPDGAAATTTTATTAAAPDLLGDALISRARLLLGAEIHKPSTIPTVQALLQLSARDLAYGQISQAWLYSGMAFRMVSDLGLQHSSSGQLLSLGHLNAEDLEIRRRLYWSCYFWDKAMSLYLGRMPTLVDLPWDSSPELLDDFAEHELWTPLATATAVGVGGGPTAQQQQQKQQKQQQPPAYPPTKSHAISCFANTCRLAVILCDIILQLYSRRRRPSPSTATTADQGDVDAALIQGIRERLDAWRAATPAHLLCEPADGGDSDGDDACPPPHILTQNLLYHTTIILLHRPFYASPVHHAACRQAADHLERLLLLLERTFGFRRITYLMAYCVYTGASVLVQDVKQGCDAAAAAKIQTFLRALRLGVASCPLVRRSLDIITASLGSTAAAAADKEDVVVVEASEASESSVASLPSSSSSSSSSSEAPMLPPQPPPPPPPQHQHQHQQQQPLPAVMVEPPSLMADTPAPPPLHNASSSAQDTLPVVPSPLLMRNYLPAFPYYQTQMDFFDAVGGGGSGGSLPVDTTPPMNNNSNNNNNMGGMPQSMAGGSGMPGNGIGHDAYDPYPTAMDIDAFSLLDCFPENQFDSATAAAWYMPQ
ncbi:hypothetical protein SCUCBS95973_002821 [Sporothrix curviconia]|uniref:Zn(2)-C6 fungal-type domain-containing protein n=1 Tax=Sporothrix curviconia TaxID=1260050 RepID=A0ABP0BAD4_9PEZI